MPAKKLNVAVKQNFTVEQIELIKKTIAVGTTDDELKLFMMIANKTGLDPFSRQIYCIKYGGKMMPQTSIDGYRLIADRTGKYAGSDEPKYQVSPEGALISASVTIYKFVEGVRCAFTAVARFSEYAGTTPIWRKMPFLMLAKCAESLVLRQSFPQELSGLYTQEEMPQEDAVTMATPAQKKFVPDPRKAKIMSLLQNLGVLSPEPTKEEVEKVVKTKTDLELAEINYDEIINRLTTLCGELEGAKK